MTKKCCISLLVENEIGVLADISGLFSGKSYNLESLAVGTIEDATISRMTITLTDDDQTFEQIKKQLNRSIEVIKVIDLTERAIHMKELIFVKIRRYSHQDMTKLNDIQDIFQTKMVDHDPTSILLECVQAETRNNDLIRLLKHNFPGRIEIVRGNRVAIEVISISRY